ncbi:MAG TPA: hypothetical protein VLG68_01775 [Gammaproteobacteria bacterium]|nr:hypothetical protein [Gammaproteobacteria bacterium]
MSLNASIDSTTNPSIDCSASYLATGYCHIPIPPCLLDGLTGKLVQGVHRIEVDTNDGSAASYTNLTYQILPSTLVITAPHVDDVFTLNDTDFTAANNIGFANTDSQNSGATVNFTVTLDYLPSSGYGASLVPSPQVVTFQSTTNTQVLHSFPSEGGRLTVDANEGNTNADSVKYAYIVGANASPTVISNLLQSLYNGATPRLLTGIAQEESSYLQFFDEVLYGVEGFWPHESPAGKFPIGAYIGLMQVPLSMDHAWNWKDNASAAAALFQQKLTLAQALENQVLKDKKDFPGLRRLTAQELEDQALVLYAGLGDPNNPLNEEYYIPEPIPGSKKFQWESAAVGSDDYTYVQGVLNGCQIRNGGAPCR